MVHAARPQRHGLIVDRNALVCSTIFGFTGGGFQPAFTQRRHLRKADWHTQAEQ
jgi:hypothetical protein